jgi:hypothetical protein
MPEGQRPNPAVFVTPLIGSVLSAIALVISNKPNRMTWGAVNAGYHAVGGLVAAVIVAVWR